MRNTILIREFKTSIIVDLPERVVKTELSVSLKNKLAELVDKKKDIGINLKQTTYVDSGIVTALLFAEKQMQKFGTKLYLIRPSDQAKELFAITSINRIISIIEDEKQLQD